MKKIHWQRMGKQEAFSWPVAAFLAWGYASAFFFLNYLRDPNLSPAWLAVWVVAQGSVLLGFFIIKLLVLNRFSYKKPLPWLNLAVVFTLGVWQAAVAIWIQDSWGLPALKESLFVIVASGAFKMVLFGLATSLHQSFRQNQATLASLLQTQNQLLGLRESAEVIVLEEELRLVQQTQAELIPQLQLLDASLESTGLDRGQREKLIQDIRNTIDTQVRPLSDELKSSAHGRALPLKASGVQETKLSVPGKLNLHDAFRPGEIFAITALVFVASPVVVIGPTWGLFGLLAALHYGLWLWLLRQLIPVRLNLKTSVGVLVLTLVSFLPAVPVSATLFAFAPKVGDSQLVTVALAYSVAIASVGLAFLHGLYQALEASQIELKQQIEELERETSRFEQQLWSARRNWGYVIHGTVQSSLTAALMHLQTHKGTDKALVETVRQDIRRAAQALRERPVAYGDLQTSIDELGETWAGVCDIDWRIADDARKALLADADLCFCTKEIVKEAVSNAVRHGGATQMTVSLEIESGHTLVLEAVNNGCGLSAAAEAGLGSQIIRELSYFWSLSTDEASGLTTLVAKMALPRAGGGVGNRRSGWS